MYVYGGWKSKPSMGWGGNDEIRQDIENEWKLSIKLSDLLQIHEKEWHSPNSSRILLLHDMWTVI